ncbi:MFS general substrate transporter [Melanomma pulvis-pyrius CBS 109.77]|uniref:MFS general substrate transporter n=1 Tax=Melanomma pulvis-pyrius CBS 109.77 TaxID=1314802 RepID=A0A6A6XAI6_9PLEO|nr:MFS general substrate transporter [Melanomma pulvis-pyrius CBS 109.77]
MSETMELQPVAVASNLTIPYPRVSRDSSRVAFGGSDPQDNDNVAHNEVSSSPPLVPAQNSTLQLVLVILQPSLVNFLASFGNGIIAVGLPAIAQSIDLPRSLYLWPSSVYSLTSGSMLLIAGSVADIVGVRPVELVGVFLLGIFTLACGLSATGVQLVVFRALQGVALAMHLPASVALVAAAVPPGRSRNIGYACLGLSQPLGFSVGLVVSGIIVEKTGWRMGFYLSGGAMLVAAIAAVWTLPKVKAGPQGTDGIRLRTKLYTEVDWIGGLIVGGGLAILAYVLAILSADLTTIHSATTASLLSVSLLLLIAFPFWMQYREATGKSALVPNALWKNIPFATTCIMVALSYGMINSMELFSSLYFQEVQNHSPFTTSLYLLPNLSMGVLINLSVGIFVDRVPVRWLVAISSLLCAIAPLIMALVNPAWSYWYLEFWGQILAPISGDVLFTVGLIIVSDNFPEKTQALAGAVFNTVAQFGQSLGIGLCQVVALGVMGKDGADGKNGAEKELKGYRAGFWTMFAYMVVCGLMAVGGLRSAGKVGLKRE